MLTRVTIDAALHARLLQLARAAAPRECVAALGGTVHDGHASVTAARPLPNAARGDDAFAVDPIAFCRADRALTRRDRRWLGFVHSHARGAAAPSARDRQQLWPDCLQLIVAAGADGDARVAAFVLRDGAPRALPLAIAAERATA